MEINLHLQFLGQCEQAFNYYQSILGGDVSLFSYANSPSAEPVPNELLDKILHGNFTVT